MDNLTGLSSVPSYPSSSPLKEQLLDVLEAKEFDLDALLKLLGLERRPLQHLKTVRELVNNYEERNEQLSLQRWERIFEGLGYSEDFLRVVTHFNEQRHSQESPSDSLESSFPNEKGSMTAVKEEIPQPSKQSSLSTTGMSQTEVDADSGFFASQNMESQDNDIVKMIIKEKEDLEMRVTSLDEKNEELRMCLDILKEELLASELSVNSLEEKLKDSQESVNSLKEEVRDLQLNQTYLVKCQRQDSKSENLNELQRLRTKISDLEEENKQLKELVDAKQKYLDKIMGFVRKPFPSAACSEDASVNDKQCPFPSTPRSVAAPVNDKQCVRTKYDDKDVMMLKVALAVASCAEIPTQTENLPGVGCVIRRVGHPFLPSVHSIGWNGFLLNTGERDLNSFQGGSFKSSKHRDRVLAKNLCLHAEVKALHSCHKHLSDATVYLTHVPCYECAKQLINCDIGRVFYLFWLKGCESSVALFRDRDITCVAFPRRDLILEDFGDDFLTKRGIIRGGTDAGKPPEECPSFVGSKDRKQ